MGFSEHVGRNLRALRSWHGLSQRELAKLCEVSPSTIQNWETGVTSMTLDAADKVTSVLGESIEELIRR